jgi:hypothetical protein
MAGDGFVRYSMSFFMIGLLLLGVSYVMHLNLLGIGLGKKFYTFPLIFGIISLLFGAAFFWLSSKQ